MKLWRLRRDLYCGARILGDVQAVSKGPRAVARRIERRWLWGSWDGCSAVCDMAKLSRKVAADDVK